MQVSRCGCLKHREVQINMKNLVNCSNHSLYGLNSKAQIVLKYVNAAETLQHHLIHISLNYMKKDWTQSRFILFGNRLKMSYFTKWFTHFEKINTSMFDPCCKIIVANVFRNSCLSVVETAHCTTTFKNYWNTRKFRKPLYLTTRVLQPLTTQPNRNTLQVAQMTRDVDVSRGQHNTEVFCVTLNLAWTKWEERGWRGFGENHHVF